MNINIMGETIIAHNLISVWGSFFRSQFYAGVTGGAGGQETTPALRVPTGLQQEDEEMLACIAYKEANHGRVGVLLRDPAGGG